MSRKAYPNVNAANQYARHVVAGKIPACQYVIDACQRHIDDLSKSQERNFDTALIKTLLSVQRDLFSFFHIQRESGHSNECQSHWSRGSFLLFAAPWMGP
jgi:phage terminase large subunit-like protein